MPRHQAHQSVDSAAPSGNRVAPPPLFDLRAAASVVRGAATTILDAAESGARRVGLSRVLPGRVEAMVASCAARASGRAGGVLRVGIDAPAEVAAAIMGAASGTAVEWVSLAGEGCPESALRRLLLDASVRAGEDGSVLITMPEHEDRPAAWYDWGAPLPLTFASVFPLRVDPARVSVPGFDAADAEQAAILRAVIDAAAATARHPARLGLADRIAGRGNGDPAGVPGGAAMTHLAELLVTTGAIHSMSIGTGRGDGASGVRRVAVAAASAWAAGAACGVEPDLREGLAEEALAVLPDRPEALLRAGAARVSAFDDHRAVEAFLKAERLIRFGPDGLVGAGLEFIQSEVDLGGGDGAAVGRIAAGLTLACAGLPPERIGHVRADVIDDLAHSGWLIGRDQDRAMLSRLLFVLERKAGEGRCVPCAEALRAASAHTLTSIFGRPASDAA